MVEAEQKQRKLSLTKMQYDLLREVNGLAERAQKDVQMVVSAILAGHDIGLAEVLGFSENNGEYSLSVRLVEEK
jgi:hypothetical protein